MLREANKMTKNVILVLEYDMGDQSYLEDEEGQLGRIPTDLAYWKERFVDNDAVRNWDMDLKKVIIKESK